MKLTWSAGLQFIAHDEHGHSMVVDTSVEEGGYDQGFRPVELVLVALAGCMGMDIVSILRKKGGIINTFEININGDRQAEHPKRYSKIKVAMTCTGTFKHEDLVRSFELSRDKYCSVYATLQLKPEIEFVVEKA